MSLTICVTTPEGVILAADSRQTYRNNVGMARVGSDSAIKIFPVNDKVGLTVAGPAFLEDPSEPGSNARGIGYFVNRFIRQLGKDETVKTISEKLKDHMEAIYMPSEKLVKVEEQIKNQITGAGGKIVKVKKGDGGESVLVDFVDKDGKTGNGVGQIIPISMLVAGYDEEKKGKPELAVYAVNVPGKLEQVRKGGDQNEFGANWTGQTDVITRVILGYDPRIAGLGVMQGVAQSIGEDKVSQELRGLEYNINWGTMTLIDAVDFVELMIKTTSAIQRYSDGIRLAPGDMPGVGGPVDVAVILPEKGFCWNKRKELDLKNLSAS